MGKNAAINQRKKQEKLRKKERVKPSLESLSIEELLSKAQEEIDRFQYETAQGLCQEALKRDADNILALETSASLCLEVGNMDSAKHCLGRAITLQPEEGHEKYMSMAQLLSGKDSLMCYQKGVKILTKMVDSLPKRTEETKESLECPDSESRKGNADMKMEECSSNNENKATSNDKGEGCSNESNGDVCAGENNAQAECLPLDSGDSKTNLVRQLSTAHCSIAELFMTDLCDEENAEEQCQAAITQGIQVDPSNPEAYQHMASFLLVKQDSEEAKTYINKSLDLWLPKYREVDEGKAEAGSFDPVEVCPLSYPTRLSTARILIEVEDYDNAIDVLDGLTEEDDEVVDTWYLLGWTYYLQGEDYIDEAKYHLHIAMKVNKESPSEDLQLVEHLQELIEEVGPYEEEETEDTNDDEIEKELEADSEDDENVEESMDTD